MSLDDYEKKRDFERTPEPRPAPSGATSQRRFVVHRHEARNLHYDLRLEQGGALCSWAVPKGFSYDSADKRLAVRTEDHPIEYLTFEGVIPKGEYGAGTMMVWDRGTYELVTELDWQKAMAKGELKVILSGRKLRGEWHLVKTKQAENTWLLFKSRDVYAGPQRDSALGVPLDDAPEGALPQTVDMMVAEGERAPFTDPGWLFEMSFAGRRVLAEKNGDAVQLRGVSTPAPTVLAELADVRAETALIDGVLVALDERGRPDPETLERRLAAAQTQDFQFYAFDLLHWQEFDLRPLAQIHRKAALRAILPEGRSLLYVDHVHGNGESLCEVVAGAGLPAVFAKRADACYGASDAWCRIPVESPEGAAQQGLDAALAQTGGPRGSRRGRVRFSNLEKVYWPGQGYTKGDLVAYYESVAPYLVPHLFERPVHMLRYPDGIEGEAFYQRQAPEHLPDWFEIATLEYGSREVHRHMVCNDRDSLLTMVNLGSIDLHPWLSRRGTPDSPDVAVIDLDPKSAPFTDVIKVARAVGRILRGIGLDPLLKTSGKTGLHVYIPLQEGYTYEHSRMFCEGVARAVCREVGDVATVERATDQRGGKVYVDFLQNRRGQTVVPPYAVRPVLDASVSTPLEWDELQGDLRPSQFTMHNVLERVAERGDLFAPVLGPGQDLMPAIHALEEYLG